MIDFFAPSSSGSNTLIWWKSVFLGWENLRNSCSWLLLSMPMTLIHLFLFIYIVQILPTRLDWKGEEHKQTLQELVSRSLKYWNKFSENFLVALGHSDTVQVLPRQNKGKKIRGEFFCSLRDWNEKFSLFFWNFLICPFLWVLFGTRDLWRTIWGSLSVLGYFG